MKKQSRYSAEVRERAVRMYTEARSSHGSETAALQAVAEKLGCNRETLRAWVRRAEGAGDANALSAVERDRLKKLERENKELRQANEILRKASAFFAQAELDRRPKK